MANKWATVFWQLDDAPQQLRRTIAMPEETVGTLMQRALEEASMMGFISEEEAFSKDALVNFQAYLQYEGQERILTHEGRLDDQLPRQGGRLLFRPSPDTSLRAAPLRLSLEGIQPRPAAPPKRGVPLVTWLLVLVMLGLVGVVGAILYKRLMDPKPDPRGAVPARAALADAGTPALDAGAGPKVDAGAARAGDGGPGDTKAPDAANTDAATTDQDTPPVVTPRKPVKRAPKRRVRRRRRKRRRRRRKRKKRSRKRSKKRSKKRKKSKKRTRKSPSKRIP